MVDLFIEMTGDNNPVHTNAEAAQAAGYPSPIVHGMLAGSMFGRVLGMKFPGEGSVIMERNFTFIRPVFVGQTYTMSFKVADVDSENHVGLLKIKLKSLDGKVCIDCTTRIRNLIQF
jgi:acyl dehydratase